MPVSYFACQGLGCCQMRSMLLLTKYNLFLHYRANTSCGSWVGYNSECHWVMDWLRSGNEANNTEQHSAKHKHGRDMSDQTRRHHQTWAAHCDPSLEIMSFDLSSEPALWWPQQCCSELRYRSDVLMTTDPDTRRGLNLNNYDFVGTDQ